MTKNPTIGGVSRELLERIAYPKDCDDGYFDDIEKLRALLDAPSCSICNDTGRVHEAGCDEGDCTRCLAPAVERQPIKNASEVAYNLQAENARLEARITQLESEAEFAAATYQAARDRIAELESGRGEPVAWRFRVSSGGEWFTTTKERVADLYRGTEDGGEVEPLFTALPALNGVNL